MLLVTMIHEFLGNISKILLVLGTIFVITKQINKRQKNRDDSFHMRKRKILYQLHVNGSKIGIIAGFIHGLTITPKDLNYLYTGWLLGFIMLVLLVTGAFFSIKQNSIPMTPQDDEKWKTIRYIKWFFTILLFPSIGLHYL